MNGLEPPTADAVRVKRHRLIRMARSARHAASSPSFLSHLAGTLPLRPYVFGFLAVYLIAAARDWGGARARLHRCGARVAFAAEWSSTRIGIPFGLYHYTGDTRGRELYLSNVPLFDSLSFTFLAYASLASRGTLGPAAGSARRSWPGPDDVARRRHRPPGGARGPLVPRADLLLPGRRLVLRRPAVELRGLGGRRLADGRRAPAGDGAGGR